MEILGDFFEFELDFSSLCFRGALRSSWVIVGVFVLRKSSFLVTKESAVNLIVTSTNYLQTSVRIERIIPRLNFRRAVKDHPPFFSGKSRDLALRLLRY